MEAPKSFTRADVIRALNKDDTITIVETQSVEIPTEYDYSGFESVYPKQTPHVRRELEETVQACRDYLSGVVITDEFTDHTKRREWRHEMFAKYGKAFVQFYGQNKLRLNNMSGLQSWFSVIGKAMDIFKVTSERAEKVKQLAARFPDLTEYDDSLSLDAKLEFVERVDRICTEFLELMSTPHPSENS